MSTYLLQQIRIKASTSKGDSFMATSSCEWMLICFLLHSIFFSFYYFFNKRTPILVLFVQEKLEIACFACRVVSLPCSRSLKLNLDAVNNSWYGTIRHVWSVLAQFFILQGFLCIKSLLEHFIYLGAMGFSFTGIYPNFFCMILLRINLTFDKQNTPWLYFSVPPVQ